jgi:hypothetical protein
MSIGSKSPEKSAAEGCGQMAQLKITNDTGGAEFEMATKLTCDLVIGYFAGASCVNLDASRASLPDDVG